MSYTVSVPARLEPQTQTALIAPVDGVVEQVAAHGGDLVRAGQPLARVRPLEADAPAQTLEAPYDGVVVRQQPGGQAGARVRRGDALWLVAPGLDWRVVLDVGETEVARLSAGQHATLRLAGATDREVHLLLHRPAPVAVAGQHQVRFEVDAQVSGGAVAGLRPGLQGVAWIDMPPKPLLQRGVDAIRQAWWLTAWGLW